MDFYVLLAFIPAALALNLTPGADMLFCLGQGLRSGRQAAFAASAGISVGSLIHVGLAGIGLGALVETVPWMFDLIRWIGVLYLLWLAWSALTSSQAVSNAAAPLTAAKAFRQGLIVNLSNPKVILFVLAFVPQFVDPMAGSVFGQFMVYGSIIAVGGFLVNGFVGAFASTIGARFTGSSKVQRRLGITTAGIFSALALRLAIMEKA